MTKSIDDFLFRPSPDAAGPIGVQGHFGPAFHYALSKSEVIDAASWTKAINKHVAEKRAEQWRRDFAAECVRKVLDTTNSASEAEQCKRWLGERP